MPNFGMSVLKDEWKNFEGRLGKPKILPEKTKEIGYDQEIKFVSPVQHNDLIFKYTLNSEEIPYGPKYLDLGGFVYEKDH